MIKWDKKVRHVLATSVLATVLTMNAGAMGVYADGNDEVASNTNTIVENEQITNESEAPTLVPGDFFYFFKAIMEQIQLSLTSDDVEKAQLIAEIAGERIKEAAALIEEGKEDSAQEVLHKALEQQELAMVYNDNENEPENDNTVDENAVKLTGTNEVHKEIENRFSQNLDSLSLVLTQFEDEEAKESIQKNVVKLTEKLNKKMEKLVDADAKYQEKVANVESKQDSGQISQEEADREISMLEEELTKKQVKISNEASKDFEEFNRETQKANEEHIREEEKKKQEEMKKEEEKKREQLKKEKEKMHEEMKKEKEGEKEKKREE